VRPNTHQSHPFNIERKGARPRLAARQFRSPYRDRQTAEPAREGKKNMSNNKMLIDATHPEETRVVVLKNNRVEEFDYESAARKLLRGNIYLAKVTRVEPSLQAAFVEYGGNRHGFLAFNEIHPDYYQIPMADRQALLEQEAEEEAREEAEADARAERLARRRGLYPQQEQGSEIELEQSEQVAASEEADQAEVSEAPSMAEVAGTIEETISEPPPPEIIGGFEGPAEPENTEVDQLAEINGDGSEETAPPAGEVEIIAEVSAPGAAEAEPVEQTGSEDALEELPSRPRRYRRSYKIQEVIKRRQVILVQVVKEERGNKGAALTTYLSLAGRYTVLMPNTARGGGISRKITNPVDRKRLKAIAAELEVPEGMGLIIRTAGASRTKQEIKRDFEYLLRLWESVRDLTLASTAPSLVYEEGNLIKRSIRDLYNKDVEEIIVAGEHAHHEAKDFMRMLMPSHAKNVLLHQDSEPLFTRYGIERQLNAMFSPYVTLRSGGYLVINQTEALVAIDVNSGKATREFSIEETALKTNLEAAEEIARQLKLRDLAGLIVIDFIDMEEKRNNRAVERQLKEALRFDRARIQLGRISHFGLMEMSRQRLRSGVLEGSTSQCPHCQGTGIIRSTESVALAVLRGLEDALMAGAKTSLVASTTATVALYILNNKRHFINDMEARHGISITVQANDKLQGANFTIDKGHAPAQPNRRPDRAAVNMDWGFDGESAAAEDMDEESLEDKAEVREFEPRDEEAEEGRHEGGGRGRRRRRRGRRGGDRQSHDIRSGNGAKRHDRGHTSEAADFSAAGSAEEASVEFVEFEAGYDVTGGGQPDDLDADGEPRQVEGYSPRGEQQSRGGRRRRRGRRGGRRGHDRQRPEGTQSNATDAPSDYEVSEPAQSAPASEPSIELARPHREEAEPTVVDRSAREDRPIEIADREPPASRARARSNSSSSEPILERVVVAPDQAASNEAPDTSGTSAPVRKGWWQRKLGSE
jgi:ribonuclease E